MKFVKPLLSIGLVSILMMGCGANDNRNDRFANDDNDSPLNVGYNPRDNDWTDNNPNVTDIRNGNNVGDRNGNNDGIGKNNNNNNQIDVADDVADEITKLDEVDNAHVLVTKRNAYVAVKLKNHTKGDITDDVEKKIAKQARKVDKELNHVFVSSNPDFFDRMNGYRTDIRNGQPVSGFFDEFTDTVNRIFPNSR